MLGSCPSEVQRGLAEKKGLCGGGALRTSPANTGERRLEEGHGSAVPLLTNGACIQQGQGNLIKLCLGAIIC
jgi:hypothetical protein